MRKIRGMTMIPTNYLINPTPPYLNTGSNFNILNKIRKENT